MKEHDYCVHGPYEVWWLSRGRSADNRKTGEMVQAEIGKFDTGLARLQRPVLPLVNMVQFLYLTGPCDTVAEVLDRMTKPVELEGVLYANPRRELEEYTLFLRELEVMKGKKKLSFTFPFIIDEKQKPLPGRQALELWIRQQVLSRELETINSLLCGPCGCVLCCTGPNSEHDRDSGFRGIMKQEFFEIPLKESEVSLFGIDTFDTAESHAMTARSEPPLQRDGRPFYRNATSLYHWQNGWSMILPEGAACPRLAADTKKCLVYEKRPHVCRKPQIFPYILEKTPDTAKRSDGVLLPVFMARNKVLAVWDCPYVRKFQQEIGAYAEMGGMEPVFKKSKT